MVYRSSTNSDWGEIFGLLPADLELHQLEKIKTDKLVELVTGDPRVEQIISNRIAGSVNINSIKSLSKLNDDEFDNLPLIKRRYNESIALNSDSLEKANSEGRYSSSRNEFVWWDRLSNGNKSQEITRWVNGKSSVIIGNKINYKWVDSNYPWLTESVVNKIFKIGSTTWISQMIPQLPEAYLLKNLETIFKLDKSVYLHSLSNEFTPESYVIKSLRALAGRKRVPALNVTLSKRLLAQLPSVMRLQVLESLLINMWRGTVKFSDIKVQEDLTGLLFGTSMKYNERVRKVVAHCNLAKTEEI